MARASLLQTPPPPPTRVLAPRPLQVVPYKQTRWYKDDTFGLKAAEEAGKNHYESFPGEHIRFTDAELQAWLKNYFH